MNKRNEWRAWCARAARLLAGVSVSVLIALPAAAQTTELPVVAARQALDAKMWDRLARIAAAASNDLLGAYPQYWLLRQQLNDRSLPLPTTEIFQFVESQRGTYLEQRMRSDAIQAAALRGDFDVVRRLAEGYVLNDPQVHCAILHARHARGGRVQPGEAVAVFTPGLNCWALYDALTADNALPFSVLSEQLRDAVDIDDRRTASGLAQYLFGPQRTREFAALWEKPRAWLKQREGKKLDPRERELVVVALARLARKDMLPGHEYFRSTWASRLPARDAAWVQAHFALLAALRQHDIAETWYRQTLAARISDYNAEWRVRAALRSVPIDWPWVQRTIELMRPELRERSAWRYWHARALAATGKQREARQEFEQLAGRFEYYGQLAAEELGRLTTIPPRAAPPTPQEMAEARANPGLRRALALFELGWRSEAVPEWNFALRGMSDRQLLAAAELAREAGIYDRVVNTSELTRNEHDFTQRFIAPYREQVAAKAQELGLDPAWVYGLIRQESRFVPAARSRAGASGLMQLMPGTARWVARRIGMTDFHPARVNDFDVNTTLGTHYLNIVLEDLDGSQLLASAGYNAGPRRPIAWRSTIARPMEGAIFAETIPFTETRNYVQKVLSNATYYTALFTGKPQSLKERLGIIAPRPIYATNTP